MKHSNTAKRIITLMTGLLIIALGVALSVKADLGVSPISCIPYILSLKIRLTLGGLTIIFNILLIILQVFLLRKEYDPYQLLQLPVIIIFGFFIDLALFLVSDLNPSRYLTRAVFCLASCIIIGFGVFLEIKAKIIYLPGEGLALAISRRFDSEFGKAKIGTDSTLVIIGVLLSLIFFHSLRGIREGTVISAMAIGYLAKFFSRRILYLDKLSV